MGLMGAGAVIATAAIGGVIARLVADDLKAWTPRGIAYLIRRATRNLPEGRRERLAEEWHGHIAETPGDISKIIAAIGFPIAARKILRDIARQRRADPEYRRDLEEAAALVRLPNTSVHIGLGTIRANGDHVPLMTFNVTGLYLLTTGAPRHIVRLYLALGAVLPGQVSITIWCGPPITWRRYVRACRSHGRR